MRNYRSIIKKQNNKGFTLVEVLVVIVILVVLFSILIPAFTGFLTKSADERDQEMAKSIFDHAQTAFYEKYAINEIQKDYKSVLADCGPGEPFNCDIRNKEFAKNILKSIGTINKSKLGYVVAVALGRCDIYADPTCELFDPLKAYTVYMAIYQPYQKNKVTFLTSDGVYHNSNPIRNLTSGISVNYNNEARNKNTYVLNVNGEDIYVQYYVFKSGLNNNASFNDVLNIIKNN